jgi:hypothetical protein
VVVLQLQCYVMSRASSFALGGPVSHVGACQLSMVDRHKTAVGEFLQAERAAVAAAAERLQEDIRVQVERMVSWCWCWCV